MISDNYNRYAHKYEKRWKSYLIHTHQVFLQKISVNRGDRILDPSCGTGLLASELIENQYPFGSLLLNDLSENMIAVARQRLPDIDSIRYSQLPADKLDQLNSTFDQIFCLNAFHHYDNQNRVLSNFWQLLETGGTVTILDWNRAGIFRPINKLIKKVVPENIETRSEREMCGLLEEAGFKISSSEAWAYRYWRFYCIKAVRLKTVIYSPEAEVETRGH